MSKPLPLQDKECRLVILIEFFFNNDLEYLRAGNKERTYFSSITKTPAARYTIEGIEDMIPTMWSPVVLAYDKDDALEISYWGPQRQQFYKAMINKVEKRSGYGYLKEVVVKRVDQKLYKFKEGDLPDLHLNEIEDMMLLIEKNKRRIDIMLNKIDELLLKRRILRSLEVLVGGRKTEMDKQLLQRTCKEGEHFKRMKTSSQNRRDLPRDIPLDNLEVLRSDTYAGNSVKELLLNLNLPGHRLVLTKPKVHVKMEMKIPRSSRTSTKREGPIKPKAAPLKPKPAVKQSVGKRNRSVDDVVSDVINDLNDSKVVKRKKSVEDDDSVGSDENVVSDERGDGDQDQDSNKDVESNKDEESNGAEESDKDDEANQTEEESNNDKESNKDEEINEAEESDQQLVNNLITKTVKRKTATKGKKKDVASESDSESEDEMVKKRGKKTKVVLKSKKREHVKGKKKDVISESDSESEVEMVKKRGKKTKVALKSKKREPVFEDKVLKVKKILKKKKKQVSDSYSSFEEEKPIMKKKKLDAKKKKKKPMTLAQIKKEKYLRGFLPLCSRTIPCSLFAAIRNSQVDMKSFL
ncbi:hypothetical protein Tco_0613918, partial [Tanacetum coccineum]